MGSKDLKRFIAALRPKELYVSTSGFTKEASYKADRANSQVSLIDCDELVNLIIHFYDSFEAEARSFFHSGKFTGLNRIQEIACQTIYTASAILSLECHPVGIISLTRPTAPLLSCTFIPCGCSDELVRILVTIPSVVIPSF